MLFRSQPIPPLRGAPASTGSGGLLGLGQWIARRLPVPRLRHAMETLDVSIRSFQAMWHRLATASVLSADAVVHPHLHDFWFLQFSAAAAIVAAGEAAANVVVPSIQTRLAERLGLVV